MEMEKLVESLIEYFKANPQACEIRASVSTNTSRIESVNVFVLDQENVRIDQGWQEFREKPNSPIG